MADQEKTEEATPRALLKARERGQVARSQDLTTALMLGTAVVGLALLLPGMARGYADLTRAVLEGAASPDFTRRRVLELGLQGAVSGLESLGPFLLLLTVAGAFFTFVQVGALVTLEPLTPKLERLDPVAGLKRTFFSTRAYVEFAKAFLRLGLIGALTWAVLRSDLGVLLTLVRADPREGGHVLLGVVGRLATWIVLALLVIGVLDLFYQRWQHRKDLRMSKEERKREYKSQEGDPEYAQRRKQMHQEILEHSIVQEVRKANVVVRNPEHLACALRFDPDEEGAPRLLAKGADHLAKRILEIAAEEGIPTVRDVSLARALFELEHGETIPEDLYEAAAAVLNWVAQQARLEGRPVPWLDRG